MHDFSTTYATYLGEPILARVFTLLHPGYRFIVTNHCHFIQCILHIEPHTLYFRNFTFSHCILLIAFYTLHLTHCILHSALYTLYLTHCTLHISLYILYFTHCTLHIALYTLYFTHCTLHIALYNFCCGTIFLFCFLL